MSILSCIFSNSITNEYRGGAINIDESEYVSITNSIFINCSATDFGGSFSIVSDVCKVHKVCYESCWISHFESLHNGCSGFLTGNNQASHILSSVYNCAPKFIENPGICIFAFHNSKTTKTKDVNVSHGKQQGYLNCNCDYSDIIFSTFDELQTVCLYFYNATETNCQNCNLLRHRGKRGSLFGHNLANKLSVKGIIFYDNDIDANAEEGQGFILYNCNTDKNSYPFETIDCSVGINVYSTFRISNTEGCYSLMRFCQNSWSKLKKCTVLIFFVSSII